MGREASERGTISNPGRPSRVGLILLLAAFLACPRGARAQHTTLGLRVGAGITGVFWEDGDLLTQTKPTLGFHLGVLADRSLRGPLFVDAELRLSRRGAGDGGAQPGKLVMDYLELPVSLGLRGGGSTAPYLRLGASVGYRIRCRMTGVAVLGSARCDDRLVGIGLRSGELDALVAIGIERSVGHRTYALELHTTVGLQDLTTDPLPPGTARNLSITLALAARGLGRLGGGG